MKRCAECTDSLDVAATPASFAIDGAPSSPAFKAIMSLLMALSPSAAGVSRAGAWVWGELLSSETA